MNRNKLTQVLSTSLSLALAVTSMPITAHAEGPMAVAPAFVTKLTPPQQFGYVASSFATHGEEKPRLIVISDLHAHVEVQHNIMSLLEDLVPKIKGQSANKVPVFLEGGWESNLEEPLRGMSQPQVRHFMDEYYVQKAEMGGPQAYSEKVAGTNQVTMIGVEDKEEYLANKARYAKTYPARRQLLEAIKVQETAMRLLSEEVEGGSFQKIQQLRDDYNAGRVQSDRFAKALLRYADRFHMQSRYVSVLRNSSTAQQSDLDAALSNVYRDVSVRLSDSRPLTSFLRQQLGNEENLRTNLARVDADLDILKRLVSNQLTPSEVSLAISRMGALIAVANKLLENQPMTVNIGDVIRQSLDFYPLAFVRDETLVKNSLASLDKMGPDATGILVAGGFHTDAIESYLAAHQIPHMVINPVISRDLTTEEQLNYVKRMCDVHVTPKEIEADVEWLKTGHQNTVNAISAGAPVAGTKENIIQRGETGTGNNDQFALGIRPEIRTDLANGGNQFAAELLAAGLNVTDGNDSVAAPDSNVTSKEIGDRLAAVQRLLNLHAGQNGLEQMTLNPALPGVTVHLVTGTDGKKAYVQEGRDPDVKGLTLFEEMADDILVATPKGVTPKDTLYFQAVGTREGLVKMGSESRMLASSEDNNAAIPMLLDRFLQAKAVDEQPRAAKGSVEEANRARAIHLIGHELREAVLPNATEEATMAQGWAGSAIAAQRRLEGGAQAFAMAVPAQLALGNVKVDASMATTTKLAEKVAGMFAPKTFQLKTATDLAKLFAEKQLITDDPAALQAELERTKGSMEYDLALAGYSGPLLVKLRKQLAIRLVQGAQA